MTRPDPGEIAARIWSKDASLWAAGDDDPAERLGWLDLPDTMRSHTGELESFARSVAEDGIEVVALLGMGGSSLAPEVFSEIFGTAPGMPSLVVLDSTHPEQLRAQRDALDLDRTLFVVSSKSGGTVETMSLYRYFRSRVDDGSKFIAITDPGTSLERLAREHSFRRVFLNPPDIGGRFSALSFFGLVPAALIGADVEGLLRAAAMMAEACSPTYAPGSNPGLDMGVAIAEQALQGRDKLTFLLAEEVASFGGWVEQLLAESTGKQGTGIVPVVDEPRVQADLYGPDRVFVMLRFEGDQSSSELVTALEDAGHPVMKILTDEDSLGAQIFGWEFATAVAGAILGINPFDQPDVEAAKSAAGGFLESKESVEWPSEDPALLFEGMTPNEYAALLAFAPSSAETSATIAAGRSRLLKSSGAATMGGFGPRYLHSTGQLHKGGPAGLRALVVLDVPESDEPIPGSEHGFARLVSAQAFGDAQALENAGRKVVRTTWDRFAQWATGSPR